MTVAEMKATSAVAATYRRLVRGRTRFLALALPHWSDAAARLGELNVIGLARARERTREAVLPQGGFRHAFDTRRVHRLAAGVWIIRVPADRNRVLRRPVAGEADEVEVECRAEGVEARCDLGLLAVAVVRAG